MPYLSHDVDAPVLCREVRATVGRSEALEITHDLAALVDTRSGLWRVDQQPPAGKHPVYLQRPGRG